MQKIIAFSVLIICILPLSSGQETNSNPYSHREVLDKNGRFQLEWLADLEKSRITFNVTARTKGYVGLGLSQKGKMLGADIVIGGVLSSGTPYFSDRHAVGNHLPTEDPSQDWTLHQAWENDTHSFLSFSRSFETCDEDHDLEIHGDVIAILWAFGEKDDDIEYHFQNRGVFWSYLLDPDLTPRELKATENVGLARGQNTFGDWNVWKLSGQQVIPAKETTYMCSMHKSPLSQTEHFIGFRTILPTDVDTRHIHHFLLERCTPPESQNASDLYEHLLGYQEECYVQSQPTGTIPTEYCSEFIYVWGVGQNPTFFPEHVGISINPNEYFLLQMHYDNPELLSDIKVDYTLEMFHTERLRQHDAALLVLGETVPATPSIMVPPNSLGHEIYGHCASECTRSIFPSSGIRVFAVFLHTHKAGRGLRLIHMRDTKELPWIAYDDNYNFDYQQIHILPEERLILPGDKLFVRCVYGNTDRLGNVTVGGFSTRQEMCVAIILYYDRIHDRSVCHSVLGANEYRNFLQIYNTTWSPQHLEMIVTSPKQNAGLLVSEVGNRMNWTIANRNRLQNYHRYLPQISQCPLKTSEMASNGRQIRKRSLRLQRFWTRTNFQSSAANEQRQTESYEFPSIYPWNIRPYNRPSVCPSNGRLNIQSI